MRVTPTTSHSASDAFLRTVIAGGIVVASLLLALSVNGDAWPGSKPGPVMMTEYEYQQLEELRQLLRLDKELRQASPRGSREEAAGSDAHSMIAEPDESVQPTSASVAIGQEADPAVG